MEIEVQFYGGLRQKTGDDEATITVAGPEPTVGDVVEAVQKRYEDLESVLQRVAYAVDDEIVDVEHPVERGDRVAFLPPVSGGTGRYLSEESLDRDELIAETADDRCGALVVFSGDVRNHNEGKEGVVAIEYEAHETIASKTLKTIEDEVLEQFEVHRCRIQHRLGRVEVGESSVLVVCRAAHRDGAYRGARYAIDKLKQRTPIWKREFYEDGTSRYLDGTPLGAGEDK